ncbi:unnamed protein product [Camellia sinensis]
MDLGVGCRAVALLLVAMFAGLEVSKATVYKVGDSAGWTIIGNIDYKTWAASKTFHVGDVIIFEYNSQYHNVLQVTHKEYQACNSSAPIATYSTGNDSITITKRGHHLFLCGFTGHCQAGQKVDINVPRTPLSPTPSPSPSSPATIAPAAPPPSAAAPRYALMGLLGKLGLSMAVFAAFLSGFA